MRALLAATATLALFAAGCGSDDDSGGSSDSQSTAEAPATQSASAVDKIDLKGFAFTPKDATVKVGQKITWTNQDDAEHNVVADDGSFKSEDLEKGDTFEYTPDKAGTFSYVCTYHSQMKATLTVTE